MTKLQRQHNTQYSKGYALVAFMRHQKDYQRRHGGFVIQDHHQKPIWYILVVISYMLLRALKKEFAQHFGLIYHNFFNLDYKNHPIWDRER